MRRTGLGRWSLQDAKNKLSAVVEAAARGQPQIVTRRGIETVVLISIEEYERIRAQQDTAPPSLADYLLSIPRESGEVEAVERIDLERRDIEP